MILPRTANKLAVTLWLSVALTGCRQPGDEAPDLEAFEPRPAEGPALRFVDVAAEVGLDAFRQVNGGAEKKYLPATTGAGVALFDADGDGSVDVFLVNGSRIGGFEPGAEPSNRLFLNQGGGESFVDVTAAAGLLSHGAWGQGCAVADVDGDGSLDLYVTNYGRNALYLNRGGGRSGGPAFDEVAAAAGVDVPGWSTGAAFLDYDRDGDLDLYVANFVDYEQVLAEYRGRELPTQNWKGARVVKGPRGLPAAGDLLFRNDGPGATAAVVFTDVTVAAGIATVEPSYGFQPALGDVDADGFPDLFVANDSRPNFLWMNQEGRGFRETGLATGVACDRSGNNQACMGVTFEDHDGDGWLDLFVTNFADDFNTLYLGDGSGFFHDVTAASGLWGPRTRQSLAWGTFFFDPDNDGDLDLFVANGHVY
ncbi:MAG: VCBS repeat-containing protein, partial [Thermoanaerobaculia bacterium]